MNKIMILINIAIVIVIITLIYFYYKLDVLMSTCTNLNNQIDQNSINDNSRLTKLKQLVSNSPFIAGQMGPAPIGTIALYSSNNIPENYLLCDGQQLLISDYPSLFIVIGSLFNKTSTDSTLYFNVPDLRSQFIYGYNSSQQSRQFGSIESYSTAMPNNKFTLKLAGSHYKCDDVPISLVQSVSLASLMDGYGASMIGGPLTIASPPPSPPTPSITSTVQAVNPVTTTTTTNPTSTTTTTGNPTIDNTSSTLSSSSSIVNIARPPATPPNSTPPPAGATDTTATTTTTSTTTNTSTNTTTNTANTTAATSLPTSSPPRQQVGNLVMGGPRKGTQQIPPDNFAYNSTYTDNIWKSDTYDRLANNDSTIWRDNQHAHVTLTSDGHVHLINSGGDLESVPRNIALNYIIKSY